MRLDFLGKPQLEFLKEGQYIQEGETAEQRYEEVIARVREYEEYYQEPGLADRMAVWLSKNWIHLSTPVLSNFGRKVKPGETPALPASCNIVTVTNSIKNIYDSNTEVAMLSKLGAGVGISLQKIADKGTRLKGDFFTNSKLDWLENYVDTAQKVSQTNRRGYCSPYIYITDPDFDELMRRVNKSNPDKNDVLVNNTVGIVLPKNFWEDVKTDLELQRRILIVINERKKTGRVYMLDEDNCNKNSSVVYKKLGLSNSVSNICVEFIQPLFDDMTSVCVISALNLVHWDEIKKNPQVIRDAFIFLDIVNEEYVRLTKDIPGLERAHKGARDKRDIGLGTLGFAEYLQIKGCAFGDVMSRAINNEIYSAMRVIGEEVTTELGRRLGSPHLCVVAGIVRRNCNIMMVAPNKSTSFLADETSLGIEPFMSNIFTKTLAKIQHVFKNRHLEKVLEGYGKNTREVWRDIEDNNGSVQHLDFLTDQEKAVFRTFAEISPKDIIDLAAQRQVYIDMGQSINLVFRKNYTTKDVYDIHKYAFEKGIKTLYYGYSSSHAVFEKDGESWDTCASCAD